jgi:hypothetical protein
MLAVCLKPFLNLKATAGERSLHGQHVNVGSVHEALPQSQGYSRWEKHARAARECWQYELSPTSIPRLQPLGEACTGST